MPLTVIGKDITGLPVDAIVNAANRELRNYAPRRDGGVCGAIFRAAGNQEMQAACDRIGGCETGHAVITEGFALPAKYVIHAAGPVYQEKADGQDLLLAGCYRSSLDLALRYRLKTVAFPLISGGIYGYPPMEALHIAVNAIRAWLEENPEADMTVNLCLIDPILLSAGQALINAER